MRATAMPGEDPETLPTAAEVSAQILPMVQDDFAASGSVYKYDEAGLFKQF
jgi:hypothetical protein